MYRIPIVFTIAASLLAQGRPAPPKPMPRGLPEGAGRDVVQRVCGSSCHGPEIMTGKGYTRDNWAAVTNGMISRGAKASADEFTIIVEYLAKNLPPRTGTAGAGGAGFIGAGPDDMHMVDMAAAERGKSTYVAECVTCHGNKGRGGADSLPPAQKGSDLVRSLVVLKDRYGATIGGFLKNGHPTQSNKPSSSITGPALQDLSHFLHLKVNETLRSGPYSQPVNVLTGNAKAGEQYFNTTGGCAKCHALTGDLAGVGSRYDPVMLQQKFLFPRTFGFRRGGGGGGVRPPKPVTVKVTPVKGAAVEGTLVYLDDFNVSLRDAAGDLHSMVRSAGLKVEKNDPYQSHIDLLDKITDQNIHDVVAYLEKIK